MSRLPAFLEGYTFDYYIPLLTLSTDGKRDDFGFLVALKTRESRTTCYYKIRGFAVPQTNTRGNKRL